MGNALKMHDLANRYIFFLAGTLLAKQKQHWSFFMRGETYG